MHYSITPVPKPRMVRSDSWRKRPCVLKYWAFKDGCLLKKVKLYPSMKIIFWLPMPKSWSKKKRAEMLGKPHQSRPDIDNLLKSILDLLEDDSHIWDIYVRKLWGDAGSIEIYEILGDLKGHEWPPGAFKQKTS